MRAARTGLCGLFTLALAVATSAAEFGVGSAADAPDALPGDGVCAAAGGACTLRAAIQEANALPGEDTVWLPAGLYTLALPGAGEDLGATGDLDVTDGLVLVGEGSGATFVDAAGLDRAFHVASPDPVEMRGLAVLGGVDQPFGGGAGILVSDAAFDRAGGSLFQDVVVMENGTDDFSSAVSIDYGDGGGLVTFIDSAIAENLGHGIDTPGFFEDVDLIQTEVHGNSGNGLDLVDSSVTVEDSSVTGNGRAGVGADADVFITVRRSTVGWNVLAGLATLGYGSATVEDSTIRENGGTGLANGADLQDMHVHNSTVTGNEGGGIYNESALVISSSTIVRNGGESGGPGVFHRDDSAFDSAFFSIRNSIVAENQGPEAPDCSAVGEDGLSIPFASEGGNLIGDATGCDFAAASGDQAGSGGAPIDPKLAPIGDYGGPTETFALLPGSPALDAVAEPTCLYDDDGDSPFFNPTPLVPVPTDQRGEARPQGAGCDVGAFEAVQLAIEVDVDPRSRRNRVRPFSRGKLKVALLGADDFDARSVLRETLRLGPGEAVPVSAKLRDVDRDGRRDLEVRVRIEDTGIALGDTELCLGGLTGTGALVSGCDAIRTEGPKPAPPPVPIWLELLFSWLRAFLGFFF